jgi:hypothetical protein
MKHIACDDCYDQEDWISGGLFKNEKNENIIIVSIWKPRPAACDAWQRDMPFLIY